MDAVNPRPRQVPLDGEGRLHMTLDWRSDARRPVQGRFRQLISCPLDDNATKNSQNLMRDMSQVAFMLSAKLW